MRPLSEIEMSNGLFGLESVWAILSLVWGTSQEHSGVTHVWCFLNPPVLLVYDVLVELMTSQIFDRSDVVFSYVEFPKECKQPWDCLGGC